MLIPSFSHSLSMKGYCPKCKEYRSDNGSDAWGFVWKNGVPICRRCNHLVDLYNNRYFIHKKKTNSLRRLSEYFPRVDQPQLRKISKRCWRCGASVLVVDKICPFCGAKLSSTYRSDRKSEKLPRVVLIKFVQKLIEAVKGKRKKKE